MSIIPGTPCLILPGVPEAGHSTTAVRTAAISELKKALGYPEDMRFKYTGTCWHISRKTTWEIMENGRLVRLVMLPYIGERFLMPLRDPDTDVSETQDRTVTA